MKIQDGGLSNCNLFFNFIKLDCRQKILTDTCSLLFYMSLSIINFFFNPLKVPLIRLFFEKCGGHVLPQSLYVLLNAWAFYLCKELFFTLEWTGFVLFFLQKIHFNDFHLFALVFQPFSMKAFICKEKRSSHRVTCDQGRVATCCLCKYCTRWPKKAVQ